MADIPGLIWRSNEQTVANKQIFIDDLDSLGMPSWDLLRPDTYPWLPHGGFLKLSYRPDNYYARLPIFLHLLRRLSCERKENQVKERGRSDKRNKTSLLSVQYKGEIHIEDDNFTFNADLGSVLQKVKRK